MEEDAGKNVHGHGDASVVDLNRAGTPLIEIVGEPDLRSGPEAAEYLRRLRELLMFLGVNDGNLEQGSFRCDANVSVRRRGRRRPARRYEMKNVNWFHFVIEGDRRGDPAADGDDGARRARPAADARLQREEAGQYLLRDKEDEAATATSPSPDLPPLAVGVPLRRRRCAEAMPPSPEGAAPPLRGEGASSP